MDPPTQAPLCLSFPVPMAPTLNPDPEALLNFACRALSQAGVQPRIVRLETEQGDQLLLAPSVRSLPTFQSAYPLLEFSLHLAFEVQPGQACNFWKIPLAPAIWFLYHPWLWPA